MSQSLVERIGVEPIRAKVIEECVELIDAQVKSKSGLSGMAIKGAYATIKTIKRGFVPSVVDALLDDWLGKLQPHHDKWSAGGSGTFAEFVIARSDDVAEDLLQVTDERAAKTSHTTAKKAYEKMRGNAKKNVIEAIPELARLIEKHMAATQAAPAAKA
ncbi:MAG: hypothetical protein F9K40_04540 [Kofleriaceae bacterium]|nr:MAG: hypothetical protein F9K40_04540 [Kofleriaceae bacterium]